MEVLQYAWLIPTFPAISFVLITLFGSRWGERSGPIAVFFTALSFILSVFVILEVFSGNELTYENGITWISKESLGFAEEVFKFGLLIDKLAAVMLFVVAFGSLIIMIYSLGYMHGDETVHRYYAEMSLFISSMLLLVISRNIVLLFVAWELVGLCSYLLIGYWYKYSTASSAAKKAIIVTRVADIGFVLGLVLLYNWLHTLDIVEIFERAPKELTEEQITLVSLLLFVGAMGKSSQVPLHVWLPDAMEGPTTVSALIHAVTMVKAGVYMVARMYPLYVLSDTAMLFVAYIGAITAFMAASMGLVRIDIKRIVAYSTMSHLGFIALALGSGSIAAGMYHLINHSMFKALLFLATGSVLHAVHARSIDIRKLGGLWRKMPITAITALVAIVSLSGLPPFGGFWSKDEILAAIKASAMHEPAYIYLYYLTMVTAFLSVAYLFRWYFIVFLGKPKSEEAEHAHESPAIMTIPLIVLAICSFVVPTVKLYGYDEVVSEWVSEYVPYHLPHLSHEDHGRIAIVSAIIAIISFLTVFSVYYLKVVSSETIVRTFKPIHTLVNNKYYFDHAYNFFAEKIVYVFSLLLDVVERIYDKYIVDGIAKVTSAFGDVIKKIQTGRIQDYVTLIFLGLSVLLIILSI